MTALAAADAELEQWRGRLAAASRNVSELSELPEFAAARQAAGGEGRSAGEARRLLATMDELWQGLLLIGGVLDRAEQARGAGRLWRGEEAAQAALAILHGASITVDGADTPVLHRRLLASPRSTATVSPDTLLRTMDAAFDRARERLARLGSAAARAESLHGRLASAAARLPMAELTARLDAAALPDPLDRLDALEALAPTIDAATATWDGARDQLAQARAALAAMAGAAAKAAAAAAFCQAAVTAAPPAPDPAALPDLAAWLERLDAILQAGRAEAGRVGLTNWHALAGRRRAEIDAIAAAASAALARQDDLLARLGALRAKHRARDASSPGDFGLQALAAAAEAALAHRPADLDRAAADLTAYAAALAGR